MLGVESRGLIVPNGICKLKSEVILQVMAKRSSTTIHVLLLELPRSMPARPVILAITSSLRAKVGYARSNARDVWAVCFREWGQG